MSNTDSRRGPYLLGIDYGTESARVGVFDTAGRPLAFAANSYLLKHPRPGWAEQDPEEWWSALVRSTHEAMSLAGVGADAIAGMSDDWKTCTVVAVARADRVVRPAIVWMVVWSAVPG